MKKVEPSPTDVGIAIGRFQSNCLHAAHKDLIQSILSFHKKVIIFLGVAPLRNTKNNPLDFRHRQKMLQDEFPNVEIYPIDDQRDDSKWSKSLDKQITKFTLPGQSVTLYGSRDSFISHYNGKFKTCELESEVFVSATQARKDIINYYESSPDFRAGLIAATGMKFPTAYQAVDIAVFNDENQILLAKKPHEDKWRFIGGFSDPSSESLEADARREVKEETGVEIEDIKYIGSAKINDWRFRSEKDCIKSVLFKARYLFGRPEADDDIEAVKWFSFDKLTKDDMVEEHHAFLEMLKK